MDKRDLENRFRYHTLEGDQIERCDRIRAKALELAELINDTYPESREKALAITNLEEAVFFANASIARNE